MSSYSKILDHSSKEIDEGLEKVFSNFYTKLESLAYDKYEISAGDLKDFKEEQKKKIIERAYGILASFKEAYLTLVEEYESLIHEKYRVPSLVQRQKIDEHIQKLNTKFDRLLKIIKAKVMVVIEDLEDENIQLDKIPELNMIKNISFKMIADSLVSGDHLFKD